MYRAVVARRNRSFDRGERVTRFGVPIISVGNLSVGGTGKTPTVRLIVERLRARGRTPAIAMRGYRSQPGERSDEDAESRDTLPDTPVVAQPDRVAGITRLLATTPAIDAVVLDDAFQHRYVARDLDIVLVDATRPPTTDRCLPAGWLREPIDSLSRAGLIVITRSDAAPTDTLRDELARFGAPVIASSHAWDGFTDGSATRFPTDHLSGYSVVVCCAIGHPAAFLRQCEDAGARIEGVVTERDHHDWSGDDVASIERLALAQDALIVTTHKDWVKLRDHAVDAARYRIPDLAVSLSDEGDRILDAALDRVLSSGP